MPSRQMPVVEEFAAIRPRRDSPWRESVYAPNETTAGGCGTPPVT
jgi:hypothetical protein